MSLTMTEYKILEMDIASLSEFREALDIFNAVGKGQMLVDWAVFKIALQQKQITKKALKDLLDTAKQSGVAVYCKHATNDETMFTDMGFAGVISPDKMVGVQLNNLSSRTFSPEEILDIRIPPSMTKDEIREAFSKLALANTMVFHSVDAVKLISSRDVEENKAFTSLLDMLLNFGIGEITTPEKARRLGYNWDLGSVPVEDKALSALAAGQFTGSGVAPDSALYEQAQERLRAGDWAGYGAAMTQLNAVLQRLQELAPGAGTVSRLPLPQAQPQP
jgi:hypothetical protein